MCIGPTQARIVILLLACCLVAPCGWAASNDNFANATPVPTILPQTFLASDNTGFTREPGEPTFASGAHTAWWKWTPTSSARVAVSTKGSGYDTVLAVYTGYSVASLTQVSLNDEYSDGVQLGDPVPGGTTSFLSFDAVAGTTYFFVVDAYYPDGGTLNQGATKVSLQVVPTVSVTVAGTAAEPATASTVTFSLSSTLVDQIRLNTAIGGSAIGGSDYATLATNLIINASATSASYTIAPIDDVLAEGPESVTVALKPSTTTMQSYRLGATLVQATAQINDNEGSIIYVDAGALAGSNNGTSWANAYTSLQSALTAAVANTQIWVKAGTYKPTTGVDRTLTFTLKNGVAVLGGFAGGETRSDQRDWVKSQTVLSGDINVGGTATDNSYRVVVGVTGATLDGFTVRDGYGDNGAAANTRNGGGLQLLNAAAPLVRHCVFTANFANFGGAVSTYNELNIALAVAPVFERCVFAGNSAASQGGAVYHSLTTPVTASATFDSCVFAGNTCSTGSGGAIYFGTATAAIRGCTFVGNSATTGGAIAYDNSNATFSMTLVNCVLSGNSATTGPQYNATGTVSPSANNCSVAGSWTHGGTGNVDVAPSFASSGDGDGADNLWMSADDGLVPLAGSQLINRGTATNAPIIDLLGRARPQNTNHDLGAYERVALSSSIAASTVIYVDDGAVGANTGGTWTDAYRDLQAALAASLSGDQIWVASGLYKTTSGTDRTISFTLKPGVAVYGGFAGSETALSQRNWLVNETELNGNINAVGSTTDNSYHVVRVDSAGSTPTLDGVTIRGGTCDGAYPNNVGGGVFVNSSTAGLILRNSQVRANQGAFGTGIFALSTLTASASVIEGNIGTSNGGGFYTEGGSHSFINCLFAGNSSSSSGGGAAIFSGTTTFTNCTIRGNNASTGGAIAIVTASGNSIVRNSIVHGNTATTTPGISAGSGSVTVNYSHVQGGYVGTSNFDSTIAVNDPKFVNTADLDGPDNRYLSFDDGLRLRADSPCANTAESATSPSTDATNMNRPLGGSYDRGAYEGKVGVASFTLATSSGPEETASQFIAVNLSNASDQTVKVAYTVTGGTASGGLDYTLASGQLSFGAGTVSQSLLLSLINDSIDDDNETVVITLTAADNCILGTTTSHTFTITDPADIRGVTIAPATAAATPLITTESGGTASFTVQLNTQPLANVTFGLVSSNTGEGTVSPASLTFTPANWYVVQTVTVTGVDLEDVDDTDISYQIVPGAASGGDYTGIIPAPVFMENKDNDVAGFQVTPVSGLSVAENGGTATFRVLLTSRPTSGVTISLTSGTGGTVAPTSLSFTNGVGSNWNVPQIVTVTGVNDDIDDGNVNFTITTSNSVSTDVNYDAKPVPDVVVVNVDDDAAGVLVTAGALALSEGGGSGSYTLRLTSQPAATVTISVRTDDGQCQVDTNAGVADFQTTLSFSSSDWSSPKTVTVLARADDAVEGPHTGRITHILDGVDALYPINMPSSAVIVTISDNNSAGVIIQQSGGSTAVSEVTPAVSDTYTVKLASRPRVIPELVEDLVSGIVGTSPVSSSPSGFVELAGMVYFSASTVANGTELWRSNGVVTELVKDIAPGSASSIPTRLTVVGSSLFFVANDGVFGSELWISDGTEPGTMLVRDLRPGTSSASPVNLTAFGARVAFHANDGSTGSELWISDGTYAGTNQVRDIRVGSGSGVTTISGMVAMGGRLYFAGTDGTTGFELYASDGTSFGTTLVADIYAGSTGSTPRQMVSTGSQVIFAATTALAGQEIWASDGISAGTIQLANIMAGSTSSAPGNLTFSNGLVYFSATSSTEGTELWVTNGTPAGTISMGDLYPGLTGSSPGSFAAVPAGMVFAADDASAGRELWLSNGTIGGTSRLLDIEPGIGGSNPANIIFAFDGRVYFSAYTTAAGYEPYRSDGSVLGTTMLADLQPGPASSSSANFRSISGGMVFLSAFGPQGFEPYRGETGSLALVADIEPSAPAIAASGAPQSAASAGGSLWLSASASGTGQELFLVNAAGTDLALVKDIEPGSGSSNPNGFSESLNGVVFAATTTSEGAELWVSDGSDPGTTLLANIVTGPGSSYPYSFTAMGGLVFFVADDGISGTELWVTDGTPAGTMSLANINPSGGSNPNALTVANGLLFFSAYSGTGESLWTSDGTPAGTVEVMAINVFGPAFINQIVATNGGVVFPAYDGTDTELWFSDGSVGNAGILRDIELSGSSNPYNLVAGGDGTVFFIATTAAEGAELWKTDGTLGGTVLVSDLTLGAGSTNLEILAGNGKGAVLLSIDDAAGAGKEPWFSDGTVPGTYLLADIAPSDQSSFPFGGALADGYLFFIAHNQAAGYEMWRTDGTVAGTVQVIDFNLTFGQSTNINDAVVHDGTLYFDPETTSLGRELWKIAPGRVTITAAADVQVTVDSNLGESGLQNSLTILSADWATERTLNVFAVNDTLYEANPHPGNITHAATSAGLHADAAYAGAPVATVIASVTDNDPAPTVRFITSGQNVSEVASTVTLTVVQSAVSARTTTIPYTVSGSASGGLVDYGISALTPSPLTIAPGATSATVTLTIVDDALDETDETITVSLGAPTNAALASFTAHTVTILDGDATPTVAFTAGASTPGEASVSSAITAQLSAISGQNVTVFFSASGSATTGTDYTLTASPITIPAGSISAAVTIGITDDPLDEDDETVVVAITSATNATVSGTSSHTATILDNDTPPTVTFTALNQSGAENIGSLTITAQLSALSGRAVTVPFTLSGSATAGGTDYSIPASPITIPAGSLSTPISISVSPDALDENNETIVVTMTSPPGNATLGAIPVHTATITDDDNPPTVTFTSASQTSVAESGTLTVTAQLSAPSGLDVTLPFTLTGSAGGSDYTITASPITFTAPATTKTITITILADSIDEDNETVVVTMGTPITNAGVGAVTVHTATITDSNATPTVEFSTATQGVVEPATGNTVVTATILLSAPSGRVVTVPYTIAGSATAADYTISAGASPLTIAAGATSATVSVSVASDAFDEDPETVILAIAGPTNAGTGAVGLQALTITITDDAADLPPTVAWSVGSQPVSENVGSATVTLQLSAPSGRAVSVP
ncbi:MAG: hypothetical protein H0W72_03585, partial [Planctomycetes bacterium]|nr:hypothetical protein [Planctomycetota bacterium]